MSVPMRVSFVELLHGKRFLFLSSPSGIIRSSVLAVTSGRHILGSDVVEILFRRGSGSCTVLEEFPRIGFRGRSCGEALI